MAANKQNLVQVLSQSWGQLSWSQDWGWLEQKFCLFAFSLSLWGLRLTWTKFYLFAFIFLSDLRTETESKFRTWFKSASVLRSGLRKMTWAKFCLFAFIFLSDLRTEADLNQVLFICFHLSLWSQDWESWLEPSSVYLLSSFSLTSGLRLTWTKFCLFAFIFLSDLRTEKDWKQINSLLGFKSASVLRSGLRKTWKQINCLLGFNLSLSPEVRLETKFCLFAFIFLSDLRTETDLKAK